MQEQEGTGTWYIWKDKEIANEIGSTERRGKNMEKKYMAKLVLGDKSKDGHGISEDMRFASNYPPEMIAEAYEKSCKETGIQFHYGSGLDDWRKVFVDYQDTYMDEEAANVLEKHGIDMSKYDEDLYFSPETAFEIIMEFIWLNMPKDWTYEPAEDEYVPINCDNIGYGLYG